MSLGSNLGERLGYLRLALKSMSKSSGIEILRTSSVYEAEPVDFLDQPKFLNAAVMIRSKIGPLLLLRVLKAIETEVGRIPRARWHEREIDIDIVFYGDLRVDSENLTIPHPRAHQRKFVLMPMAEIEPGYVHPVLNKTVSELLDECPDNSHVVRIEELKLPADYANGI